MGGPSPLLVCQSQCGPLGRPLCDYPWALCSLLLLRSRSLLSTRLLSWLLCCLSLRYSWGYVVSYALVRGHSSAPWGECLRGLRCDCLAAPHRLLYAPYCEVAMPPSHLRLWGSAAALPWAHGCSSALVRLRVRDVLPSAAPLSVGPRLCALSSDVTMPPPALVLPRLRCSL